MKKLLLLITAITLTACGTTEEVQSESSIEMNTNQSYQAESMAVIELVVADETIDEMTTDVEAGNNLLNITKENYDVEEEGGFVSSINGFEQDEATGLYWTYTVNDEMVNVGAEDYEVQVGDTIEWRLASFEE